MIKCLEFSSLYPVLRLKRLNRIASEGALKPVKKIKVIHLFFPVLLSVVFFPIQLIKTFFVAKGSVYLWTYNINRFEHNGREINKFYEPLKNSAHKLYNFERGLPSRLHISASELDTTPLEYFSVIFAKIGTFIISSKAKTLMKQLFSSYGTELSEEEIFYLYRFVYLEYFLRCYFYLKRPKLCVVTNWYGLRGLAVVVACRNLDIVCADYQHGLAAASNHRAYTDLVFYRDYEKFLPNYFLTWTRTDSMAIDNQGVFDIVKSYEIGIPWVDYISAMDIKTKERTLTDDADKPSLGPSTILYIAGVEVEEWFIQFLKKRRYNEKSRVLIKQHPSYPISTEILELIERYASGVELIVSHSLAEILLSCDLVLGEWSGGLLEANYLGKSTIVVGTKGHMLLSGYSGLFFVSEQEVVDNSFDLEQYVSKCKNYVVHDDIAAKFDCWVANATI